MLLHLTTLDDYSPEEQAALAENKKVTANKTLLEKELERLTRQHNKSHLITVDYIPHVESAITNAEKLDIYPERRWTDAIGTRVYRLAISIIEHTHR